VAWGYGYFVSPQYLAMNDMMSNLATAGYPEHTRLVSMQLTNLLYYAYIVVLPIFAMGIGAVLGLIFVRVQRKLPFSTITRKALFFAFIASLIVHANYLLYQSPRSVSMAFFQLIVTNYILSLIVDLAAGGLLFSYLLTKR
jgi:hypothetical protein